MKIFRTTCCTLLLGTLIMLEQAAEGQALKVLVLEATSGKPQNKVNIRYFCEGVSQNSPPMTTTTNSEGLAMVRHTCGGEEKIDIEATALPKEKCGGMESLSLKEISSRGIVTVPDRGGAGIECPTKVSKKLMPVPGQVIIFIKKPNWFQSHF